jgi:hypothetical protein
MRKYRVTYCHQYQLTVDVEADDPLTAAWLAPEQAQESDVVETGPIDWMEVEVYSDEEDKWISLPDVRYGDAVDFVLASGGSEDAASKGANA